MLVGNLSVAILLKIKMLLVTLWNVRNIRRDCSSANRRRGQRGKIWFRRSAVVTLFFFGCLSCAV